MTIDIPQSASPLASIIIPATSTLDLLLACLRSLARFGPEKVPFETIVILNEASAETEQQVRESVTGIVLVNSPDNLGMAGVGNRGRSLARGQYLITLHDDAEIEAGWMEALIETAQAHPEAGAVGGKVLYPDGRLQNAGMILWRNAHTSRPWAREAPPATAFDRLRAVDYCGTSSLLVRADVWDAVGGLDETFYPAYYVDVDLSMAIRRLGYVVLYQPLSRIRHHQGASTSRPFRSFVSERNRRLFLGKWGEALDAQEPQFASPEAVERAIGRAENFAAFRRTQIIAPLSSSRPGFDAIEQQRRLSRQRRALQDAYIAFLEDKLAAQSRFTQWMPFRLARALKRLLGRSDS